MTNEPNLGPLTRLVGAWEGSEGKDVAPSDDRGTERNDFRERMSFEPIRPVDNHEQKLWGLRYSTMAWRLGEADPFHEEVGYWLWDPKDKQVMRCFVIPRGVSLIAGGPAEPNAESFELSAEAGSATYGIASNRFLDLEFKTIRFLFKLRFQGPDTFSYEEDSQLKIKGQPEVFHHTDGNTLHRIR